ncbi:MAG TPA: VOC family protein, partial [Mucilaginibacter sp.]|nr:VOC family protein [Mucilaginibacter sp.]
KLVTGNNFTLVLSPDTHEDADKLYAGLSEGSPEGIAPHEEFWGYWGTCTDRFGIRWMFNIVKQWS